MRDNDGGLFIRHKGRKRIMGLTMARQRQILSASNRENTAIIYTNRKALNDKNLVMQQLRIFNDYYSCGFLRYVIDL